MAGCHGHPLGQTSLRPVISAACVGEHSAAPTTLGALEGQQKANNPITYRTIDLSAQPLDQRWKKYEKRLN